MAGGVRVPKFVPALAVSECMRAGHFSCKEKGRTQKVGGMEDVYCPLSPGLRRHAGWHLIASASETVRLWPGSL